MTYGHAVIYAGRPTVGAYAPAIPPGAVLAGAALVASATVAGAWLARRRPAQRQVWFAAAAGALLAIAGMHLLPDAWRGARDAGTWPGLVPTTAIVAFAAAGLAARSGCGCQEHKEQANGACTAAALTVHRFLEGAALALAGSVVVTLALTAHALGEGLATGALLGEQPPRRVAGWLTLMCLSPVAGAAAADAFTVPMAAEPVLLAMAAGVLIQAARVSLRAAFRSPRPARFLLSGPAAASTMAAIVTVVAVNGAG